MNNNTSSLLSQFSAEQLNQLRSPHLTLAEKDELITRLKAQNRSLAQTLSAGKTCH